jgi:DNA-directed RNA polymerase II subunit RPB11
MSAMNAPDRYSTWRWEDEDDAVPVTHEKDTKMPNASLIVLQKEDHTLGNIIRLQLLRDRRVRFAGYRMPHPTIHDCHIKLQTMEAGQSPLNVFDDALEDLGEEMQRLKRGFKDAFEKMDR